MVMFAVKTVFLLWRFLMSALFWNNRKKHHRALDFGQTATEHFYIFQDRIQCWMNIFLAFFPETFTSSTMAIQSSITRPYLGPLKAQKKSWASSARKRGKSYVVQKWYAIIRNKLLFGLSNTMLSRPGNRATLGNLRQVIGWCRSASLLPVIPLGIRNNW